MDMADMIVAGIVLVIVGAAVRYLVKAKKKGVKCIGCPSGCDCSNDAHAGCGCGCMGGAEKSEKVIE